MTQLITLSAFFTLPSSSTVLEAVVCMHQAQTQFLLVVDQHLVGIVTESHVFQALATGRDLATLSLSAVMMPSSIALQETEVDDLVLVLQHFRRHQLQYLPVINNQNQPVGVISYQAVLEAVQAQMEQDTADRQQTQAALQCREQSTRLFLSANPNLMIRLARDGTYLDFFPAKGFKSFTPDANIRGKNIFQLMPVSFAHERMYYVEQTLQTGTPQVYEFELEVEGDRRYQEAQISVSGEDEVLIVVRDITDRKQMEIALQESEEKFRQLASNIQDVFWILSPSNFSSVYVSPTFEKVWGQSCETVYNNSQTFIDSIHPDDRERVWNAVTERNQQGGDSDLEYRIVKPNGEVRWIHDRGTSLRNELGQVYRVVGIASDITDRKRSEEALQQAKEAAEAANRAKSEFLSRMSHELRTPLTSVLGFADLIAKDTSLNAEHQANLAIIHRSGTHLLNLINSVLEMSKIEAGELTLHETSFDLHHLLENIRDLFQLKATSKGLTLSVTWNPDLPQHIQTDENKLRQVLINLLDNAIKFTDTGRVILRVSRRVEGKGQDGGSRGTEAQESRVWAVASTVASAVASTDLSSHRLSPSPSYSLHFQIKDTGAGIAPEELDLLFNAFTQTETGRKLQQGTGLGLAISQQFVRMMGGEITVASQLGQGTILEFDIRVLAAQAVALASATPQQIPDLSIATTRRILVVDDQMETRKVLVKLLEPIGFEVQEAADGQEAVTLWETWQPHLIWMDIHMPIMNGHRATREIRARERQGRSNVQASQDAHTSRPILGSQQATKIIALTADVFDPQRSSVLAAGCDDFVVKPFQHTDILQKIAEHLSVQYFYPGDQPSEAVPAFTPARSFPTSPVALPDAWNANLRRAALRLHADQCLKLIEQLPANHSPLAQALTDCVNRFQFNAIVDWVEQSCDR